MKTHIIMALGLVIVMGVAVFSQLGNTTEVMKVEKEEIVKEVTPDWATDEDAIKAAQDVIRKKELEAELKALEGDNEVLKATYEVEKALNDMRIEEIEKELGTY